MTINVRIKPDGEFLPNSIQKDPSDVIDVVVDYSQYFKTDDITTTTVTGTNVTIDSSAEAANVVTIFISAGTNGTDGEIKITTSSATRTLERTIIVEVDNK
jgi:hypothetical protein